MSLKIALAGNPNSGKTTLFNALTGSNQFVGNWPGVTVEKKEGKLKGHKDVVIMDLPGIYSLSPYTLEEVVARNYLIGDRPDAIINIIDGTNIERNLYLSTQILELGIPVVMAVNMMDLVKKNGDQIRLDQLKKKLGCEVVEISALKGTGIDRAAELAVEAAKAGKTSPVVHEFAPAVEAAIRAVEDKLGFDVEEAQKRFFAIKLLERDDKIGSQMKSVPNVEKEIKMLEDEFDDDTESIITNERYQYIGEVMKAAVVKARAKADTISDKIDRVVTNRILALPIFALVMWLVYFVSVTTVGTWATDWANDGVFGDGWHFAWVGDAEYCDAADAYGEAAGIIEAFVEAQGAENVAELMDAESETFDSAAAVAAVAEFAAAVPADATADWILEDEETLATEEVTYTTEDLAGAVEVYTEYEASEPDPAAYGIWIPGIPALLDQVLVPMNLSPALYGLIMDGIVGGVGAVLGFVPQILVLFIFLAFLEACGYMARVAFIMDRIFRRFGLSGRSFIPYMVGLGCGVPGIMATRTIENQRDRRMTIITTTFIPCGAKLPFIAMMAGAIFGNASWVAPSAYFLGIGAIICSGIILKKTKIFAGDPAPFVMELPAYHMPTVSNVLRSMWERGWSFIKKAGSVILISCIIIWFLSYFGFVDGAFTMLEEDQMEMSLLAAFGRAICWIFIPTGWGNWQATVAAITGLVAKENIVGTMGIVYGGGDVSLYTTLAGAFTSVTGFSFMAFNLLCAPCFAALGAIKREMNNGKWFWIAVGYQCGLAYLVAMVITQLGNAITGAGFGIGAIVAAVVVVGFLYLLFRPAKKQA